MLYRLEEERNRISIRHVETDSEVGYVLCGLYLDPAHGFVDGCTIHNNSGKELAKVTTLNLPRPLEAAAIAAAAHQEHHKFRDLRGSPLSNEGRIERRLGNLLADVALHFARGFCEATDGGLTAVTRDEFSQSLAALAELWWVSRFECFDASRRRHEPYFSNPLPLGSRLSFGEAAQVYGLRELRSRYPHLSDVELNKLVGWCLRWLSDVLCNELENQRTLPN